MKIAMTFQFDGHVDEHGTFVVTQVTPNILSPEVHSVAETVDKPCERVITIELVPGKKSAKTLNGREVYELLPPQVQKEVDYEHNLETKHALVYKVAPPGCSPTWWWTYARAIKAAQFRPEFVTRIVVDEAIISTPL